MDALIPDSPEEIRRLYRGLLTREALDRVAFGERDEGYLGLARILDGIVLASLPLLMPGSGASLASIAAFAVLSLGTSGLYHLLGRGLLFYRFGNLSPFVERPHRFWSLGPASFLFLLLALPPRVPPDADPRSLEVLEPVAREIAAPLLARAQAALREGGGHEVARRIHAIEARLAELRREEDDEDDPGWRATIAHRISALEARLRIERGALAQASESLAALAREADAVARGLETLARHRRLLREIRDDGDLIPPGHDVGTLRHDLALLARSVAGTDRTLGERLRAEEELRRYLDPPA